MEKTEPLIEKFAKSVDSLKNEMLDDKQGYILFAYNEEEGKGQENIFASCGKFGSFAEMLFACMKSNPALANIMMAAVNAYAQSRVIDAAMQSETPVDAGIAENVSRKKRRNKIVS